MYTFHLKHHRNLIPPECCVYIFFWRMLGIGAPMLTSRPWLDPVLMGEAKILVEVKLDRPFPQQVALEDEDGLVSMVTVIYSWLPSKCPKCGQLGHKAARCLGLPPIPVSKDRRFDEPPQTCPPHSVPVTVLYIMYQL